MPGAFKSQNIVPPECKIPDDLYFDYLIYRLSSKFGIEPDVVASNYTEYDYYLFSAFASNDAEIVLANKED